MITLDTTYNNPWRLKAGWSPLAMCCGIHIPIRPFSSPKCCRRNLSGLAIPTIEPARTKNYVYNTLISRSGTSMHQMKSGGRGFRGWKRDPHSSSGSPHQPMTWASPPQQESIMSNMLPATLLPTKNQLPPQLWDLVELNVLWLSTTSE